MRPLKLISFIDIWISYDAISGNSNGFYSTDVWFVHRKFRSKIEAGPKVQSFKFAFWSWPGSHIILF